MDQTQLPTPFNWLPNPPQNPSLPTPFNWMTALGLGPTMPPPQVANPKPVTPPAPVQMPPPVSIPTPRVAGAGSGGNTTIQLPPLPPRPPVPLASNPPAPSTIPMPNFEGTRVPIPDVFGQHVGMPDYSRARSAMEAGRPTAPNLSQESSAATANILGGLARGAGSVSATEPGSFARALAMAGASGSEARGKGIESGMNREQEYERERTRFQESMAGQERTEADSAQRAREFNAEQDLRTAEARQRAQEFNALRAMTEEQERQRVREAQAKVNDQYGMNIWKNNFENENRLYEDALKERGEKMPKIEKTANGFGVYDPNSGQMNIYDTRTRMEKLEPVYQYLKGLNPGDTGADLRVMQAVSQMQDLPPNVKMAFLKEWTIRQAAATNQLPAIFGHQWGDIVKQITDEFSKDQNMKIMSTTHPQDFQKLVQQQAVGRLMTQLLQSGDDQWLYDMAASGSPIARWMTSGQR